MKAIILLALLVAPVLGQNNISPLEDDGHRVSLTWGPDGWPSGPDPRETYVWTRGTSKPCEPQYKTRKRVHFRFMIDEIVHPNDEISAWTTGTRGFCRFSHDPKVCDYSVKECFEFECLESHKFDEETHNEPCRSTGKSATTTGTDQQWIWQQQNITIWVHEPRGLK